MATEMWRAWPHLSLADRCCLAAAERLDVTVYTADSEWAALDSGVRRADPLRIVGAD